MTKILDIPQSIVAANGNTSLAKELFTMLLGDLELRLQQIKDSFSSNNIEMLAEHIHKLYGATAYCIVPRLRKSAEVLESELRQNDLSQLNGHVESVLQEIQQLINDGPDFIKENWANFKS